LHDKKKALFSQFGGIISAGFAIRRSFSGGNQQFGGIISAEFTTNP
jgi:hypothetical protein